MNDWEQWALFQPSASAAILSSVPDENQRALLKSVMESREWKVAEMAILILEQARELSKYRTLGEKAEEAVQYAKKLRSKLASAEQALNAGARTRHSRASLRKRA